VLLEKGAVGAVKAVVEPHRLLQLAQVGISADLVLLVVSCVASLYAGLSLFIGEAWAWHCCSDYKSDI